MSIDKELLEVLACPKCKGTVYLKPTGEGLVCNACKLMYPIQNEIPIMVIEEAVKLS